MATFLRGPINKTGSVRSADRPGVSITPLFEDERETVQLEVWDAGTDVSLDIPEGAELLVLDGGLSEGGDDLQQHSWLRLPQNSSLKATAGSNGAKVWVKYRHLRYTDAPS